MAQRFGDDQLGLWVAGLGPGSSPGPTREWVERVAARSNPCTIAPRFFTPWVPGLACAGSGMTHKRGRAAAPAFALRASADKRRLFHRGGGRSVHALHRVFAHDSGEEIAAFVQGTHADLFVQAVRVGFAFGGEHA